MTKCDICKESPAYSVDGYHLLCRDCAEGYYEEGHSHSSVELVIAVVVIVVLFVVLS